MDYKGGGDANYDLNGLQRFGKWTGRVGNRKKNRDNSDYRIVKI